MKIKYSVCFLLIICLLALTLVACGKDDGEQSSNPSEAVSSNDGASDSTNESSDGASDSTNESSDDASDESSDDASDESSDDASDTSDENDESAVAETVTVNVADKEFQIDGAIHFIDEKAMNTDWHLKITISEPISKFNFFSVNSTYEPGSPNATVSKDIVDEILFSYGKISADAPILIDTYVNDAAANRGISYVDENGETKYYVFLCNQSGVGSAVKAWRFFVEE